MRVQVQFFTFLDFILFILSSQTFPQTHIPTGNVNGKWIRQNSPYYIDDEIKIPYGKKLIIEAEINIIFSEKFEDAK